MLLFVFIRSLFLSLVLANIDSAPYELSLIYQVYKQNLVLGSDWLSTLKLFNKYDDLEGLDGLDLMKQIFMKVQSADYSSYLSSLKGTDIDSLKSFFSENGGEDKIKAGFIASKIYNIPNIGNSNSNYATKLNMLINEYLTFRGNFVASDLSEVDNFIDYVKEINSIRKRDFIKTLTDENLSDLRAAGLTVTDTDLYITNPSTTSIEDLSKKNLFTGFSLTPHTHISNILWLNSNIRMLNNYC